jgi:hypothetical protein
VSSPTQDPRVDLAATKERSWDLIDKPGVVGFMHKVFVTLHLYLKIATG